MNLDLEAYNAFLKEFYEEGVESQFARQTVLLDEVVMPRLRGPKHIAGKYAVIAVESMALGGVGSRGEDEDMPEPEPGIYENTRVALAYHYFSARVTGPTLELSQGSAGAFDDAETRELLTKTNAFLMNINRNLHYKSDGCIARVDATPAQSGLTFTIDRAGNRGSAGYKDADTNGAKFITKNMRIEIWSALSGGSQIGGTFRVTAVAKGSGQSTSATITVDTSPGTLSGDEFIFQEGSRGKDMNGLGDIYGSGTLQNLTTTEVPEWQAVIKTGATAGTPEPISRIRIEDAMTDAEMNSGVPTDLIVTDRAGFLSFADYCAQKRIQVNTLKLSEGWSGADFNGNVAIVPDLWAPPLTMRGIPTQTLSIYEGIRPGFIKYGGDVLKPVGRRDTYEANYRWYVQMGVRRRGACWELQDIDNVV